MNGQKAPQAPLDESPNDAGDTDDVEILDGKPLPEIDTLEMFAALDDLLTPANEGKRMGVGFRMMRMSEA